MRVLLVGNFSISYYLQIRFGSLNIPSQFIELHEQGAAIVKVPPVIDFCSKSVFVPIYISDGRGGEPSFQLANVQFEYRNHVWTLLEVCLNLLCKQLLAESWSDHLLRSERIVSVPEEWTQVLPVELCSALQDRCEYSILL